MLISIRHVTRYVYAEPVSYSVQSLRLTPAPFIGQRIVEWQVEVSGATASPLELRDGFGNTLQLVTINTPHRELTITASGLVETENMNGVVAGLARTIPARVYLKETPQTRPDAAIRTLAQGVAGTNTIETLHALSAAVRDKVDYVTGATDAHTGAAEALGDGKGVCQDHAHIFISAARTLGIPARYVTGYLVLNEPPPGEAPEPASAHHAWAEAHVEGLGWVAFDIANCVCPTDRYVRLACGLDAAYTAPVVGSRRGGSGESLDVRVAVQQQSAQQ
jgi:transglutaminase-like putative cysteine protease